MGTSTLGVLSDIFSLWVGPRFLPPPSTPGQTPEAIKILVPQACTPPSTPPTLRPHQSPKCGACPPWGLGATPRCALAPNNPPTHHDPEGVRHLGQGVGVVRGDGWDARAPHQGEEPRCIDRVEVHTQVPGSVVPVKQAAGWMLCSPGPLAQWGSW